MSPVNAPERVTLVPVASFRGDLSGHSGTRQALVRNSPRYRSVRRGNGGQVRTGGGRESSTVGLPGGAGIGEGLTGTGLQQFQETGHSGA